MSKKENKKAKKYMQADEQDEARIKEFALSDLAAFKKLYQFILSQKWGFVTALFMISIASLLSMVAARYMGIFVEDGLVANNKEVAFKLAFLFITIEALYLLLQWRGRYMLANYSSLVILKIREALFNKLQILPINYFDTQPQGRVVTRVTHDVEELDRFFTQSLGRLLISTFMMITSIGAMVYTKFDVGIILTLSMIPAGLFIYFSRNWVRRVNRRMSKASSATNSKLSELISGLEVIRSFGKEEWSKNEYDNVVQEYYDSSMEANTLYSWSRPIVSFLCAIPLMGLVSIGGMSVLKGTMSVGLFVAFVRYTERFFHSIMMIAHEYHVIQTAFTSAERVNSFLSEKEEDDVFKKASVMTETHTLKGNIEFKNVEMGYTSDKPVLKGLSFSINAGERIGFVGTTGSGKTTTVSLLSRLYEFQSGQILLDGIDIRSYERGSLRRQIGFVSQDVVIIKGTLRDNLNLDTNHNDESILRACEKTGLLQVMEQIPMSLDSELLEGGANLSVGQRQLVALTRIILKDPSILILDEATANIDPAMEKVIQKAVDLVMVDRTCLMIAHRLATLEKCDRIFVFEQGKLVEQGSEKALMQLRGKFWGLYNSSEFVSI